MAGFSAFRGNFGSDSQPYFDMFNDMDSGSVFKVEPGFWLIYKVFHQLHLPYIFLQLLFSSALIFVLIYISNSLKKKYIWDFLLAFFATGYYAFLGGQRQALAILVLLLTVGFLTRNTYKGNTNSLVVKSLLTALSFHYSSVLGFVWLFRGVALGVLIVLSLLTLYLFQAIHSILRNDCILVVVFLIEKWRGNSNSLTPSLFTCCCFFCTFSFHKSHVR
jgi:ABC-type antimicrobial peptide transport system permease subunit